MRAIFLVISILVAILDFTDIANGQVAADASQRLRQLPNEHRETIEPVLLAKIRPLYPTVRLERDGEHPFFSKVKEIARVQIPSGEERLVVEVGWTVPAASVDHGGGDLLIYWNAADAVPLVKCSKMSLGIGDYRLIENHWLKFSQSLLVSLLDRNSLEYLKNHGKMSLLYGLSQDAARKALSTYMKTGLESFLRLPLVKERSDIHIRLPERVSKIEEYPSLNEDFREADFRYSSPWEGTLFFRLTAATSSESKIILKISMQGETVGIASDQVKLVVWNVLTKEPVDRPEPVEIFNTTTDAKS